MNFFVPSDKLKSLTDAHNQAPFFWLVSRRLRQLLSDPLWPQVSIWLTICGTLCALMSADPIRPILPTSL